MGITWDERTDNKLLMGIITNSKTRISWTSIAEYIGPECTAKAAQRRFEKLKDVAQAAVASAHANTLGGPAAGAADDSEMGDVESTRAATGAPTPEKRKRGRPAGKKAAAAAAATAEGEEDASPAKVQKGGKGKGNAKASPKAKGNGKAIAVETPVEEGEAVEGDGDSTQSDPDGMLYEIE